VSRVPAKPAWWKNTYFWIGGILLIVAMWGLVRGPESIRDPGQKREDHLVIWLYLAGGVVMLVNGWLSHRQTMQHFAEIQEDQADKSASALDVAEQSQETTG
jgi:hypothetical protein